MHGQGTFYDPRLDDATRFPIAAANGFGHVRNGRFASLGDVVDHYDRLRGLSLTAAQKADLVEYLKSL